MIPLRILVAVSADIVVANAMLSHNEEQTATMLLQSVKHHQFAAPPEEFLATSDGDAHASVVECLEKLAASTVADSTCKLASGTYYFSDPVVVPDMADGVPRHITAQDPGNKPKIVGTVKIPFLDWQPTTDLKNCKEHCYYADFAEQDASGKQLPPWQLFLGKDMFINARWPNAKWSDDSLFNSTKTWATAGKGSQYVGFSTMCAKKPSLSPSGNNTCDTAKDFFLKTPQPGLPQVCQNTKLIPCQGGGPSYNTTNGHIPIADHVGGTSLMVDSGVVGAEYGSKALANENVNVTGAVAVMNIGHWETYTSLVKKHNPGTGNFTYEQRPGWNVAKYEDKMTTFFLESHPDLLDAAGEWYYDSSARRIYVKLSKALDKSDPVISARTQKYAFTIGNSTHLTLSHLDFFATTVFAAATEGRKVESKMHHLVWDDLTFEYPSMPQYMLKEVTKSAPTTMSLRSNDQGSSNNVIKNSKFLYVVGPVVHFSNNWGLKVENNLFSHIDWVTSNSVPAILEMQERRCASNHIEVFCMRRGGLTIPPGTETNPTIFRRNTVHMIGVHVGVRVSTKMNANFKAKELQGQEPSIEIELNRFSGLSDLQLDGGLYTGSSWGVKVRRNWMYDSVSTRYHGSKWGMRFDRAQSSCGSTNWKYIRNGEMSKNVLFRTTGVSVKGNNHKIFRNTIFDTSRGLEDDPNAVASENDLTVYGSKGGKSVPGTCQCDRPDCKQPTCCPVNKSSFGFENMQSIIKGNLMQNFNHLLGGLPFKVSTVEVDVKLKSQGLPLSDSNSAGMDMASRLRDTANFDFRTKIKSLEAKQCLGAYDDSSNSEYWIPGHQEELPTSPVPPDHATTLKETGALMFNPALGAVKHLVFISRGKRMKEAYTAKVAELPAPANVVELQGLLSKYRKFGVQYYWRVDPVLPNGSVLTGATWHYQVKADESLAFSTSPSCFSEKATLLGCITNTKKESECTYSIDVNSARVAVKVNDKLLNTSICIRADPLPDQTNFHINKRMIIRANSSRKLPWQQLMYAFGSRDYKDVTQIDGCLTDTGTVDRWALSHANADSHANWSPKSTIANLLGGGYLGKYQINTINIAVSDEIYMKICFDPLAWVSEAAISELDNGVC